MGARMAVYAVAALSLTFIQSVLAGPGFVNNVTPGAGTIWRLAPPLFAADLHALLA